jgi:hypothetical protein
LSEFRDKRSLSSYTDGSCVILAKLPTNNEPHG